MHGSYLLHKRLPSRFHIAVDRKAHSEHGNPPDLSAKWTRQPTRVDKHACLGFPRDCVCDDLGDIVRGGRVRDLLLGVHDGEAGAGVRIVESKVHPKLDGPCRAYPHDVLDS